MSLFFIFGCKKDNHKVEPHHSYLINLDSEKRITKVECIFFDNISYPQYEMMFEYKKNEVVKNFVNKKTLTNMEYSSIKSIFKLDSNGKTFKRVDSFYSNYKFVKTSYADYFYDNNGWLIKIDDYENIFQNSNFYNDGSNFISKSNILDSSSYTFYPLSIKLDINEFNGDFIGRANRKEIFKIEVLPKLFLSDTTKIEYFDYVSNAEGFVTQRKKQVIRNNSETEVIIEKFKYILE